MALPVPPVHAVVYQYFDEDGTLIVTDSPHGFKRKTPLPPPINKKINLSYREDVNYDYYTVSGKNLAELISLTEIYGPFDDKENKKFAAQTRWNLGWSYKFDYSYRIEGETVFVSLNIFDVDFKSNITVTLPVPAENAELGSEELKHWEKYVAGLLEHEHDHVRIIKNPYYWNKALNIISGIKELALPYSSEAEMDAEIKSTVEKETEKIGRDLMMEISSANDEYDRLTVHGLKPEMREVFFKR